MIFMVVNTGVIFITCKEHQGHAHAQPCCYGQKSSSPAAVEEKQWRWQGHERDHTLQDMQQTSLSKWDEHSLLAKRVFCWG